LAARGGLPWVENGTADLYANGVASGAGATPLG
jgi:hypothetical protein